MSFCAYGEPTKLGAHVVLYCDRDAETSFNWPIPGGQALLVRVCGEHADELDRRVQQDRATGAPQACSIPDGQDA